MISQRALWPNSPLISKACAILIVSLRITHPIKLAVEHRVIIVWEYLGTRLCRRLILWLLTLWPHLSAVGASD